MCYQGEYTCGALIEDERPKRSFDRLYAVGSWDGYATKTEMLEKDTGLYSCVVPMGDIGCEQFYLTLGGDRGEIYPIADLAGAVARVEGPSSEMQGRQWLLDGRSYRQGVAGKLPQFMRINLEWHDSIKRIFWEAADGVIEDADSKAIELKPEEAKKKFIKRGYFIVGGFSNWMFKELQLGSQQDTYEGSFQIGDLGFEEFQFARDIDWRQCIHPATKSHEAMTKKTVLVRGPDPHGKGKNFKVSGQMGETVRVKLQINGGRIAVSVTSCTFGSRTWYSAAEAREYYVVGSVTGGKSRLMRHDSEYPGVYFCEVEVGRRAQEFHILIDEDVKQILYPSSRRAHPGECYTKGPDRDGAEFTWLIDDVPHGTTVSIVLDTNQDDRRVMVYWTLPEQLMALRDTQLELGDGE
jgi:hypothetical protein